MPLDVHFIIDPQKGSQRSATKYVTLSKPSNKASTQWTARECWNWKEPNRGGKQQRQRNMKKTWTLGKKKQGKQGQKGGSRKAKRAGWKEKPTAHNAFECGAMEQKMSRRQRHLLKATPFHGLSSSSLGTTRLHSTHPQASVHPHIHAHTHKHTSHNNLRTNVISHTHTHTLGEYLARRHIHSHIYTKAHTNTRGRTRTTKSKVNHWNFAS